MLKSGFMLRLFGPHILCYIVVLSVCTSAKKTNAAQENFIAYDTAPEPIEGFAVIQKNLVYPINAVRLGIQGRVVLNVLVDEKGNTVEIKVLNSLNTECDRAAINAVRNIRWKPAKQRDRAVKVWIGIPIEFRLDPFLGLGRATYWLRKAEATKVNFEKIEYYTKAIKLQPNYATTYYSRGDLYLHLEQYEEAIQDFDRVIHIKPDHIQAYAAKVTALRCLKRYGEAVAALDEAIRLKPDYFWAYNQRGLILGDKGDFELAVASYDSAIKINPEYAPAYAHKGHALRHLGRYEEALAAFDKSIQLGPRNAWVFTQRGIALKDKGDHKKAIESFEEAIKIDPDYDDAYNQLGWAYLKIAHYDKAIKAYKKSIELDSSYTNSYSNLGWVYYLKGNFRKCIDYSEKAFALDSTVLYARYNIALAYLRLGQIDRAKKLYAKTRKYNLSLNLEIRPGAIEDLQDLIEQDIMAEHARMILVEIFGLANNEPGKGR